MTNSPNFRGICEKSLGLQMTRKSRRTNLRHPYLAELDSRFYGSLDFINFRPKNIFSIDVFPCLKNKTNNSFFNKSNWYEGSFPYNDLKTPTKIKFFTNFVKNLFPFSKRKQIFYPTKSNQYIFADNSFDCVEALAVIPWANDPISLINEIHRLLDSGGFFGFASFGPETLKTLVRSLDEENKYPASKSFLSLIDLHDIGDFCTSAGFVNPVVASNQVCFKYKEAETALSELRALSGNPRSDRDNFLRGKKWYETLISALNKCKDSDGFVSLEFEFIYGHAWKAEKKSSKIQRNSNFIEKQVKFF